MRQTVAIIVAVCIRVTGSEHRVVDRSIFLSGDMVERPLVHIIRPPASRVEMMRRTASRKGPAGVLAQPGGLGISHASESLPLQDCS